MEGLIGKSLRIRTKDNPATTLNNGLALAEYSKPTITRIPDPKLLRNGDNIKPTTVPDKYTGLGGSNKDITILTGVYVDTGVGVE